MTECRDVHLAADSRQMKYSCMLVLDGILSGIQLHCSTGYSSHRHSRPYKVVFTHDGTDAATARQEAYLKRDDIYEAFSTWWKETRRIYVDPSSKDRPKQPNNEIQPTSRGSAPPSG